jgi:hypothetical protein
VRPPLILNFEEPGTVAVGEPGEAPVCPEVCPKEGVKSTSRQKTVKNSSFMLWFYGSEIMIFYYPFYNYQCYAKVSMAFKDRILGRGRRRPGAWYGVAPLFLAYFSVRSGLKWLILPGNKPERSQKEASMNKAPGDPDEMIPLQNRGPNHFLYFFV